MRPSMRRLWRALSVVHGVHSPCHVSVETVTAQSQLPAPLASMRSAVEAAALPPSSLDRAPSTWRQHPSNYNALWARSSSCMHSPSVRCYCSSAPNGSNDSQEASSSSGVLGRLERRVAMVFTCVKCDTRSVKTFSRRSYDHGLVLVRCPGCQKLHLVADHLGWFGDKGWTIEQLQEEAGVRVKAFPHSSTTQASPVTSSGTGGPAPTVNDLDALHAEDWIGWSRVEALLGVAPERRAQQSSQTPQQQSAGSGGVQGDGAGGDEVWEVGPGDLEMWRKVRQTQQDGSGRSD